MTRITTGLVAALFVITSMGVATAQAPATPTTSPAPAKMKLNKQSLKEMKAKWSANKGKLKACRKDVKVKGLAGDDRWFYIEECMGKS
jgi:hypothetical protein